MDNLSKIETARALNIRYNNIEKRHIDFEGEVRENEDIFNICEEEGINPDLIMMERKAFEHIAERGHLHRFFTK